MVLIAGVVQRRTETTPTTPAEAFTDAVERLETATKRLHGLEAPTFPKAAYKSIDALQRAIREVHYAINCIDCAERLEKEDA